MRTPIVVIRVATSIAVPTSKRVCGTRLEFSPEDVHGWVHDGWLQFLPINHRVVPRVVASNSDLSRLGGERFIMEKHKRGSDAT
ncbi:MAG: hypothetical protein VXV85_02200 [Candidatus Thermoplasmatota archaeon]|nr:hypothetical protein [Candidatus Thermoplasmatota archaeon]